MAPLGCSLLEPDPRARSLSQIATCAERLLYVAGIRSGTQLGCQERTRKEKVEMVEDEAGRLKETPSPSRSCTCGREESVVVVSVVVGVVLRRQSTVEHFGERRVPEI